MIEALLMKSLLKTLIRGEAVVRHAARPVDADDFLQNIGTALGVDGVERGSVVSDPGVKPDRMPSQTPTGFVGSQMFGIQDVALDLLVNRLEFVAAPQDDLGTGARRDRHAIDPSERVGDLAIGQVGTFIEINNGGLGVSAELAPGGAGGRAGLQGVSATQPFAAALAMATVDGELPHDGLAWEVGLELLIEPLGIFDDAAAAVRTLFGQRGVECFVDFLRLRWRSMAMLAVLLACFASWFSGPDRKSVV